MAPKKQLHMSLEDRMFIEECLNAGIKKNQIAVQLGKDKSTVTKEIKKRSRFEPGTCTSRDPDSTEQPVFAEACSRRDSLSGICNGCAELDRCTKDKRLYSALEAHQDYAQRMSRSRSGLNMTQERKEQIRQIVREGLEQGLCLKQIHETRPDLSLSLKSLYNYKGKGLFDDLLCSATGDSCENRKGKDVTLKVRRPSRASS